MKIEKFDQVIGFPMERLIWCSFKVIVRNEHNLPFTLYST